MLYLIIPLIVGLVLGYLFLDKRPKTETSITFRIFTYLWINTVCLLIYFLFPELVKNSCAYLYYPKYEAEIVEINSEQKWSNTAGDRRRVTMHTPIIKFKLDNTSKYIKRPLNIISEEKPKIGTRIKIAFKYNSIYEISYKGYIFLVANAYFVIFLSFPIIYLILVILDKKTIHFVKFGVRSIIYMALIAFVFLISLFFK
ncbi:hypothetical protein [Cellulophaga baltica]|uniref:hypothetical protein n=1 Tax=Cellulophaga baltica TaxID=76594 RepID=UPI00249538B3|nr:hypothetical protein [Cellulophaga baltica]